MVLPAMIFGAALSTASLAVSGAPGIVSGDYLYPSCGGGCRGALPRASNPEVSHVVPAPARSATSSPGSATLRAAVNAAPSDSALPRLR